MFKVGDVVEITGESDATGMLDFVKGRGYEVININCRHLNPLWVKIKDESEVEDWFHHSHFKLKGGTVEKKECLFKEGQVVWDDVYGRGAVSAVFPPSQTMSGQVQVEFDSAKGRKVRYTLDGKYQLEEGATYRTLFFSEPKIEAATEPVCGIESLFTQGDSVLCRVFGQGTVLSISEEDDDVHVEFKDGGTRNYTLGGKLYDLFPDEVVTLSTAKQAFTPTLKEGDVVIISCFKDRSDTSRFKIGVVEDETEEYIYTEGNNPWDKDGRDFYRLGEKINFK